MRKSYWIAVATFGIALMLILFIGISLLGSWNNWGWRMMGGWPSGMMHGWGFAPFGWIGITQMLLIPVGFVVLVVLGAVGLIRGITPAGGGREIINQQDEFQRSSRDI